MMLELSDLLNKNDLYILHLSDKYLNDALLYNLRDLLKGSIRWKWYEIF